MLRCFALTALLLATTAGHPDDSPQSPTAKAAKKEFQAALKKLEDDYQRKAAELSDGYLKQLESARADALAKKDLDEAQRIVAEQTELAEELPAAAFQIVFARFGWNNNWHDVTPVVKKLVQAGELRLERSGVANKGFPDPAFGQHKSLVVVYRYRGVLRIALFGDDKPLVLPDPR